MFLTRATLAAAILLIGVAASIYEPSFLGLENVANILTQAAVLGIVAIGMTFVILSGGIDLSVGSIAAFGGVLFALILSEGGGYSGAFIITLLASALMGVVTGVLITKFKLSPFIATLGMMGVARGLAFVVSGGEPISGVAAELRDLYRPLLGLITPAGLILIVFSLMTHVILHSTVWGMRLAAIGSNETAAKLSGLRVARYKVISYIIVACCAGAAGMLLVARFSTGQPLAGYLYELDAIAAAVIGGGSLKGGRGDVLGTFLGVLLITELRNVVIMIGMPSHAQPIVIGVLLIVAVAFDLDRSRTKDA